jgi:hypothetical protein
MLTRLSYKTYVSGSRSSNALLSKKIFYNFKNFSFFTKTSARKLKTLHKNRKRRALKAQKISLKLSKKVKTMLKRSQFNLQESLDLVNSKA